MQDVLRNRFFVLGLIVGIVLGLIVGWGIWPVRYSNAYPVDLRASDKLDYILLVSREFQRTGDYKALAKRLRTFPKEELPQVFTEAEKAYAQNPEYLTDIQKTWEFIKVNSPEPLPSPAASTAQTEAGGESRGLMDRLIPLAGVVAGLLIILYALWRLYQWVMMMREAAPEPLAHEYETETFPEDEAWEEEEPFDEEMEGELVEGGAPVDVAPPPPSPIPAPSEPRAPTRPVPSPVPPAEKRRPPLRVLSQPTAPAIRLVETLHPVYMLQAQTDEGYDEAFTIYDETRENLGECGMGEAELYQEQPGRPTVMEVWLFDKHDAVTRQGFILSPWAYNQPDIRQKYEESGRIIVAKPGAVLRLTARSLYMEGEIKDVAFAQIGNGDEVFSKLALELKVFKRLDGEDGDGESK